MSPSGTELENNHKTEGNTNPDAHTNTNRYEQAVFFSQQSPNGGIRYTSSLTDPNKNDEKKKKSIFFLHNNKISAEQKKTQPN
jgi:hypothetical protein